MGWIAHDYGEDGMRRRCFVAFAALLVLNVPARTQSLDRRPELTVALNAQPANLDPAETPFAANFRVSYSIFDTLIRRDFLAEIRDPAKGLTLAPGLATAWKRLDDRTLELNLRPGVRFHNGAEMSAEDVAFSLSKERIFGARATALQAKPYIGDIEAVEAVDRFTVRVRAAQPDAILEYRLAQPQAGIVPKDAYANGADAFKRHPVGTGPIRLVEWRDNDRLRFEAFDDYFGGRPAFRSMTFRIVPELAARIAGLVSGEFDVITQVTPDQIALLKRYSDITVRSAGLQSTQEILFDVRHPAVANREVRKALSLAIDRELIVRNLFHGQTAIAGSWQIPEMGPLYLAGREDVKFDLTEAKRVLRQSGYKGESITLRYPVGYYPNGDAVAQAVAKMWRDIGINVKLEAVETIGQVTGGGAASVLIAFTYDMPLPEFAVCQYRGAGTRYKAWMPKEMERYYQLCADIAGVSDPLRRREMFGVILDELRANFHSAPLYQQTQVFATRKSVDWQPYPHFFMDFRREALRVQDVGKQ
jgi:peptide/nickel transport system substrate-binding protein